jgi:prevent-host-death family protein
MPCLDHILIKNKDSEWKLQDAKNRFSEVFERALREGPQIISRRGTNRVVVMAYDDYDCLTRPQGNIVDFFKNSPFAGAELDLERIQDLPGDLEIGG